MPLHRSPRNSVTRQRGGQQPLLIEVDIVRHIVDDLDDGAAGELEARLVVAAHGIATVVADGQPFTTERVVPGLRAEIAAGRASGPAKPAEEIFDRLEAKYAAMGKAR